MNKKNTRSLQDDKYDFDGRKATASKATQHIGQNCWIIPEQTAVSTNQHEAPIGDRPEVSKVAAYSIS